MGCPACGFFQLPSRFCNGCDNLLIPMMKTPPQAVPVENFAALFEESLARMEMRIGEVITAEVVRIDDNFVVINAGLKSESYVAAEEFLSLIHI